MIRSRDNLATFLPKKKPKLVILGTMAAIKARDVDDLKKDEDAFFYHNPNNHFWRILQLVFEPKKAPQKLSVKQKKAFLEKWQIAITNIVEEIQITKEEAKDPSDSVIFKAHTKGRVKFKKLSQKLKKDLRKTPMFFTSAKSKGIEALIDGYLEANEMTGSKDNIGYLLTPTRCNPIERSLGWKIRFAERGVPSESVTVPRDFV